MIAYVEVQDTRVSKPGANLCCLERHTPNLPTNIVPTNIA